jgi:uncharacterized protein YecE (DUF72 family)
MRILTGTSGYSFKEWKGKFYPDDLPADGMLRYYAGKFPTVEINNTFYRMPKESVVLEWAQQVPDGFKFAIKASQRITHIGRLKDVGSALEYFLRVASALGDKLGPTLFQLPPNFKKDVTRLEDFLKLLPRRWRAAFEFRHPTWHDEEVYGVLRQAGAALCISDQEDTETPVVATTSWGYLRLHRPAYDAAAQKTWAQRIKEQAWEEAFVYFKHDDDTAGPELAAQFAKTVG